MPQEKVLFTPGEGSLYPRRRFSLPQEKILFTPGEGSLYPKRRFSLPQEKVLFTPREGLVCPKRSSFFLKDTYFSHISSFETFARQLRGNREGRRKDASALVKSRRRFYFFTDNCIFAGNRELWEKRDLSRIGRTH
jgi:hypothetical protein